MSEAYISQVMAFGFGFAPKYWALCNGQILAIQQNTALFSLLGTMYGGNGTTTFALPNLQSRVMLHKGTSPGGYTYVQGEIAGAETVTIDTGSMPAHGHTFSGASANANSPQPSDNCALATIAVGSGTPDNFYAPDQTTQALSATSVSAVGGSQAHSNIQPFLTINWCICQFGIYPSRN